MFPSNACLHVSVPLTGPVLRRREPGLGGGSDPGALRAGGTIQGLLSTWPLEEATRPRDVKQVASGHTARQCCGSFWDPVQIVFHLASLLPWEAPFPGSAIAKGPLGFLFKGEMNREVFVTTGPASLLPCSLSLAV